MWLPPDNGPTLPALIEMIQRMEIERAKHWRQERDRQRYERNKRRILRQQREYRERKRHGT